MTYSWVNYRAPLRVGRDHRRSRPEMPTAVDARVPHVPIARTPLLLATLPADRQLFWQRPPICIELYSNVTHSVVVAVADAIIRISA